jgi:hypothetical protein
MPRSRQKLLERSTLVRGVAQLGLIHRSRTRLFGGFRELVEDVTLNPAPSMTGAATELSISRSCLIVLSAAFLIGLLQIPWHEGAHALACRALRGVDCAFFFNMAPGRVSEGGARALHVGMGPAASLLLAIVAAIAAGTARHAATLPVAFAVTLVTAYRPVSLAVRYFLFQVSPKIGNGNSFDEVTVAHELHLRPSIVVAGSAVAVLVCVWLVLRRIPRRFWIPWMCCVGLAGMAGQFAWLRLIGPVVLPWRVS